jgi:mono/diheme cytochrome c family protein
MKSILLSIILTLVVLIIAGLIYIYSGIFDPSQTTPHKPLTQWVINKTLFNSIEKRVKEVKVPDLEDTAKIALGARHYNEMCVACHGAPGVDPSELVEGLNPKPPRILKPEDIVKADEAFWIIRNGIKMTSMPAFAPTHTDDEIWAITAFSVNKLVKMSESEYLELTRP